MKEGEPQNTLCVENFIVASNRLIANLKKNSLK